MTTEDKYHFLKDFMDNLGKGSYRWLIYDKLGFDESYYEKLVGLGVLDLNNSRAEDE